MRLLWLKLPGASRFLLVCEPPVPLTFDTHEAELALAEQHALSTSDAKIVAAALKASCDTLYSQDMHHGLIVDGRLTITNSSPPLTLSAARCSDSGSPPPASR